MTAPNDVRPLVGTERAQQEQTKTDTATIGHDAGDRKADDAYAGPRGAGSRCIGGAFNRDRVPDWLTYAGQLGIKVEGRGTWRSILCDFHADTHASLRVNTKSGGWCCMSCGASGRDALAHHMARTGLGFVAAARGLGAWDDNGIATARPQRARTLSARDGLALLYADAMVLFVIGSDIGQGKTPTATERVSAAAAARRVLVIYEGINA